MSRARAAVAELLAPVAEGMERVNEILAVQLNEESPAVRDMTGHVGRFKGKQLRAALVLLSGDATGNSTDEHAAVASIVEMIHLATLVHDDILDGAEKSGGGLPASTSAGTTRWPCSSATSCTRARSRSRRSSLRGSASRHALGDDA